MNDGADHEKGSGSGADEGNDNNNDDDDDDDDDGGGFESPSGTPRRNSWVEIDDDDLPPTDRQPVKSDPMDEETLRRLDAEFGSPLPDLPKLDATYVDDVSALRECVSYHTLLITTVEKT